MIAIVAVIVASWLAGSIPSAWIVTKIATGKDIRALGSGNAGATNVFRVLGMRYAIPVFLFDFLKGFLPVLWVLGGDCRFDVPGTWLATASGTASMVGHIFPVFTGLKGGKGAATGAGVVTALCPPLFPACLAVFLPVLALTRKMSLASISAAVAAPLLYLLFVYAGSGNLDVVLMAFLSLVPAIIALRHASNIRRLIEGTETKLF